MPEQESNIAEYQQRFQAVVKARNFHYKSFLNWSTYFSVIVGALFVALYTIIGSDKIAAETKTGYVCLISVIGYIVSLCWHWSNKGYNYWWNHWSAFLTDLEKDKNAEQKVYGVFYDTGSRFFNIVKPANYSTSKIATLMSFIIAVVLGFVALRNGWRLIKPQIECLNSISKWIGGAGSCSGILVIVIEMAVSILLTWRTMAFIAMHFLQTNLDGHYIKRNGVYISPKDRKERVPFSCQTYNSGEYIWDRINNEKHKKKVK